jgi:tetratricopeptide (TPR) repeat protein
MPSSSPPPRPSSSSGALAWWMVWRIPGWVWITGSEAADSILSIRKRPAGRAWAFTLRLLMVLLVAVMLPLVFLLNAIRKRRPTAAGALHKKVVELWQSSPYEAVELLRTTFEALKVAGGFEPFKRVEVPPFGRFDLSGALYVYQTLFKSEFALGRFEEALQVSRSLPVQMPETILEQVDCLMAMGRRPDAIAHLEKNLGLDTWKAPLRRRLEELTGKPGAGVN